MGVRAFDGLRVMARKAVGSYLLGVLCRHKAGLGWGGIWDAVRLGVALR